MRCDRYPFKITHCKARTATAENHLYRVTGLFARIVCQNCVKIVRQDCFTVTQSRDTILGCNRGTQSCVACDTILSHNCVPGLCAILCQPVLYLGQRIHCDCHCIAVLLLSTAQEHRSAVQAYTTERALDLRDNKEVGAAYGGSQLLGRCAYGWGGHSVHNVCWLARIHMPHVPEATRAD